MVRLFFLWLATLALTITALVVGRQLPPGTMMGYTVDHAGFHLADMDARLDMPLANVNKRPWDYAAWAPGMRHAATLQIGDGVYHVVFLSPFGDVFGRATLPIPEEAERGALLLSLRWSPNGETLRVSGEISSLDPSRNVYAYWLVGVDGDTRYERVVQGDARYRLRWSPDGAWLAELTNYTEREGRIQSAVNMVNTQTGAAYTLALPMVGSAAIEPTSARWSDDSKRLAILGTPEDAIEEMVLYVAEVGQASVTAQRIPGTNPDNVWYLWQGSLITYGSERGELITYDMNTLEQVAHRDTGLGVRVRPMNWTPDGLIFHWQEEIGANVRDAIGLARDTTITELGYFTNVTTGSNSPQNSGEVVMVGWRWRREAHVFLYRDGELEQITPYGTINNSAVWSPDGEWIAFRRAEGRISTIQVMHPDGSDEWQVSRPGADSCCVVWYQPG